MHGECHAEKLLDLDLDAHCRCGTLTELNLAYGVSGHEGTPDVSGAGEMCPFKLSELSPFSTSVSTKRTC